MEDEKMYYTFTELKELGFSKSLIEKNFKNPLLKDNPYYRSASKMKLYLKKEIDIFMESVLFKEHLLKREKRVKVAKEVANRHRNETMDYIDLKIKEIKFTKLSKRKLLSNTIKSKEQWYQDYILIETVPSKTLNRWMINYIRHELTEYDEVLYNLRHKTGHYEAYIKYKEAITNKIKEIYPELFDEENTNYEK